VLAELYEHLAESILEMRAAEDNLVKGLLLQPLSGSWLRQRPRTATDEP
jgi:hypothetical protein